MLHHHLPGFYQAFGANPTYHVLRSFIIRGHEAAWVQLRGRRTFDPENRGREGEVQIAYDFVCECPFTYGIGWIRRRPHLDIQLPNHTYQHCPARQQAASIRCRELHQEYRRLLKSPRDRLVNHCPEIIADLFRRMEQGEFIGHSPSTLWPWDKALFIPTFAQILHEEPLLLLRPRLEYLAGRTPIQVRENLILPRA